ADREAAEREAVEGHRAELVGVRAPQIRKACTLHDSEERLLLRARRVERARRPPRRHADGVLDGLARRLARRTHVELHLDVGAEKALDAHGLFGREVMLRSVEMRTERDALLFEIDE